MSLKYLKTVSYTHLDVYKRQALAGKYNYLNPKKSATVPGEYIKQVLMRGTGFIGGKGRVCKIFETEILSLIHI